MNGFGRLPAGEQEEGKPQRDTGGKELGKKVVFSKGGQFLDQFLGRLYAGELVGEQLEGGVMKIVERGSHAVGGEGYAVVAGGSRDDGAAHADVGRDAGGHEVGDALAAQG